MVRCRGLQAVHDGIYIAPNGKYIPKLAELLEITEWRGKTVPHHSALVVFDAESIPMEEYLMDKEAQIFRSALGICPRKTGHPTNCQSFGQLHGTTYENIFVCTSKAWKLLGPDPGHEDALCEGRTFFINFDKMEWSRRKARWSTL